VSTRGRRLAVYTDYRYRRSDGRLYAERAFALFLIELARHVDRLTIVGKVDPEPGESHYELPPEIEFAELEYFAALTQPVEVLRSMRQSAVQFWRVLDGVDAVWLLGPHPLAVVFALLAALRRRSVTLGVRQDFRRYVRARHPHSRWIAVAGDALEGIWRAIGRIVPVVAVGPDLARQYPPAHTLQLSVSLVRPEDLRPADDPLPTYDGPQLTALSVGRLEEEKNPLLLADILALLVADDARWRLVVCGEGPFEQQLRGRLDELGVSGQAELRGYVPNDGGLRELYRDSHALLHVSWTEGLPQVLFEAFAARLPVVATAVGGVREAAGDAALLIGPGDAGAAADALHTIVSEPAVRERLRNAGIAQVNAHTIDAEAAGVADFVFSTRG
jgi:glycosyltransferase involved in cell wall biosynthesis